MKLNEPLAQPEIATAPQEAPPAAAAPKPAPAELLRFDNAEIDRAALELRIGGKRAPLGPRAVSLLLLLVDERERAISKHELLDRVWAGVVVEENNLQVQISTLRRLLGPMAIATIPGRGYRFMLPLAGEGSTPTAAPNTGGAGAAGATEPPRRGSMNNP